MNQNQVVEFLNALGAKQINQKTDWITCSCPLAPWKHKNGKDSNPSFGLSSTNQHFHCFSCLNTGTPSELLYVMEMYNQKSPKFGIDFKTAHEMLDSDSADLQALPPYSIEPKPMSVFQEWPDWWLNSFIPVSGNWEAVNYLESRKVPVQQWVKFNLRYDSSRRMVVFPYYSVHGLLAGARGRSIDAGAEGIKKHYDYAWNGVRNTSLVWFNEQCLAKCNSVYVVEGPFDALRLDEAGFGNVLACMSSKPTAAKIKTLLMLNSVVLIPDNDETGAKTVGFYASSLSGKIKFHSIVLPQIVKDAGECDVGFLSEYILTNLATVL